MCAFHLPVSLKGCRGNGRAWVSVWGGGNMKIFEDWYTELNLLSIAAQMTTNLSAPPPEILSKAVVWGVVWMKFLQELYSWSWAYSYTKLEAPTNSSRLATKWPRREDEPGSLGGWHLFCAWGCHLMWWLISQKIIRGKHAGKEYFLALTQGKGLVKGEARWEDWRLMNLMTRVPPWTCDMEKIIC